MQVFAKIKQIIQKGIRNNMIEEIDAQTLSVLMKEGKVVLVDVREPEEYSAGHIDQAVSIPLSVFAQKFDKSNFPQDKKIVLQCQGGVRSMKACNIAHELAEKEHVANLTGGLNAWKSAGLPVVK